jgi:hypothetical protein
MQGKLLPSEVEAFFVLSCFMFYQLWLNCEKFIEHGHFRKFHIEKERKP